jgi:hypothetical protein
VAKVLWYYYYSFSTRAQYLTLQNGFWHPKFQLLNLFPTPLIKLELGGLPVDGRRLLITTHLDESNYLPNQKQGTTVNKYDLSKYFTAQGSTGGS